jgi:hypothetical protein
MWRWETHTPPPPPPQFPLSKKDKKKKTNRKRKSVTMFLPAINRNGAIQLITNHRLYPNRRKIMLRSLVHIRFSHPYTSCHSFLDHLNLACFER